MKSVDGRASFKYNSKFRGLATAYLCWYLIICLRSSKSPYLFLHLNYLLTNHNLNTSRPYVKNVFVHLLKRFVMSDFDIGFSMSISGQKRAIVVRASFSLELSIRDGMSKNVRSSFRMPWSSSGFNFLLQNCREVTH